MTLSRKPHVSRWLWWAGLSTFGAVALVLASLAYRDMLPGVLREYDKATHFVMAGALVFFLDGALQRRAVVVAKVPISAAWLFVLVPAAAEEYLQRFATFRTSELWDFLADVAGATVCLWLSRLLGT